MLLLELHGWRKEGFWLILRGGRRRNKQTNRNCSRIDLFFSPATSPDPSFQEQFVLLTSQVFGVWGLFEGGPSRTGIHTIRWISNVGSKQGRGHETTSPSRRGLRVQARRPEAHMPDAKYLGQ